MSTAHGRWLQSVLRAGVASLHAIGARLQSPRRLAPPSVLRALVATALLAGPGAASAAPSVLDIQPFAQSHTVRSVTGDFAELIDLNSHVGAQYLLRFGDRTHHLQFAAGSRVTLTDTGLDYRLPGQPQRHCALFTAGGEDLNAARGAPFNPVCGGDVYVRQKLDGYKPGMAAHAELLRSWGAWTETLIDGYKEVRARLDMVGDDAEAASASDLSRGRGALRPAEVDEAHAGKAVRASKLGIELTDGDRNAMPVGHWLEARHHDGVYVSVLTPGQVAPAILQSYRDRVNSLAANGGSAQRNKLAYLVAFDLGRFSLGWMHGTAHPGVGWSPRPRVTRDNPHGPDGFRRLRPLVPTGAVNPAEVPLVTATFSGGFQRRHGAFRRGVLSTERKGHHYGFIEDGVVLSTLQPHLATLLVDHAGRTDIRTWTLADDSALHQVRFARQNGVPLIEGGGPHDVGVPGALVGDWGQGNWSGSADLELRTPRSAACLLEEDGERALVFAYFSGHTPSGMVRVLQAYRCDQAIHLDMNSAGQAYFALLTRMSDGVDYRIEHLVTDMRSVDAWVNKRRTPRYLLKADYRDLFYVKRRQP